MQKHYEWKGKIEIVCRVDVSSRQALMEAYTPGVAAPCLEIHKDVEKNFLFIRRWNTVPVITDGYPRYLLTLDKLLQKRSGVKHMNLINFMLKNERFV